MFPSCVRKMPALLRYVVTLRWFLRNPRKEWGRRFNVNTKLWIKMRDNGSQWVESTTGGSKPLNFQHIAAEMDGNTLGDNPLPRMLPRHHQDYEPFLVGDPYYKPSFATVTGRGDNPRNTSKKWMENHIPPTVQVEDVQTWRSKPQIQHLWIHRAFAGGALSLGA